MKQSFDGNQIAHTTETVYQVEDAEYMEEYLFFELQDKDHTFMLGLSTVLECLRFAEEKGEVPELSASWWDILERWYPQLERPQKVPDND